MTLNIIFLNFKYYVLRLKVHFNVWTKVSKENFLMGGDVCKKFQNLVCSFDVL